MSAPSPSPVRPAFLGDASLSGDGARGGAAASTPLLPPSPPPGGPAAGCSCLLLFPPPVGSSAASPACEFDAVLLPAASAPSPRPSQLAAAWPTDMVAAAPSAAAAHPEAARRGLGGGAEAPYSARSSFLPAKRQSRREVRKVLAVLLERGVVPALEELARKEAEGEVVGAWHRLVGGAAGAVLAFLRTLSNRSYSLHPHLTMSGEDMIDRFSETRAWLSAPVRCVSWHPHTTKFAVALRDGDSVQVHGLNLPSAPLLRYKQQRGVACLAWRPFSASELAVGCLTGLLVWTVDPTSVAARPSASSVVHLTSGGHAPVTGLQWDHKGKLLLSSSAADTSMILWNTASETKTALRRFGGGGVHLISWSASSCYTALSRGAHILAATPSTLFRIWDVKNWRPDQWNVLPSQGRVQSACWSPSGSHLLFATAGEATIFVLEMSADSSSSPSAAVPLADVSAVAYDTADGNEITLGGPIQSLKWDPLGERLAVSFQESDAIAIFCTNLYPCLSVSPIGLIMGQSGEFPTSMDFAKSFDEGALLTIAWSSGRLEHVPMLFIPNMNSKANVLGGPVVLNPDFDLSFHREDREDLDGEDSDLPPLANTPQLFSPR